MIERIASLWPEIVLFVGACVVMLVGLSPNAAVRRLTGVITGISLFVAAVLGFFSPTSPDWAILPNLMPYAKPLIAFVGLLLVLVITSTVDRDEEAAIAAGKPFSALRVTGAEFYAFFLFSIMGAMLCATAGDLIWLFLALELTSLPTYVMVVLSGRGRQGFRRSQEAGVKYFFLGALGAAIFLYGFALLYGGTGTTRFVEMGHHFAEHGINPIAMVGMVLAIVGISFKIAAVPMHFYTADVYQGASSSMAAFLAFVPKTAGIISILLLVSTMGWAASSHGGGETLPPVIDSLLWAIAVLTMTVGNVLAVLQKSVKRMLAYSSIAHSGYMLVGIIAGPGDGSFTSSGLSAVLFYLLVYGVTNTGAFAVLASLERTSHGETVEAEDVSDLRGLCKTNPWLGWPMVLCMLSLLGFPPILGFFGKVPLFTSAIGAGRVTLVVILGINSAIAAFYYLRVVATVMLEEPADTGIRETGVPSRVFGAVVSGVCVIAFSIFGNSFMSASTKAGEPRVFGEAESTSQHETNDHEAVGALGSQVQSATVVTPKKIRMH
ncbi:NADH-ubiquinone oxidoreductase chain N [hydrothermal vent metagenome]|uniref:NADH-ubiquinone oxidoreductase chain N n=1 Tax=hydrothermal vent metagenome TaxID=652676 RepID=A0A3B1DVJ8_9ZZZZ